MAIPRLDAHNMASRRAINRRVWTFERNEARHVQALPTWPATRSKSWIARGVKLLVWAIET